MPVTIKSTGGGSVTVQAPNTATDYTVNFPAANGDMVVAVSGAVPASQGGTGQTSLTANNVLLGNGTSAVQFVAPGSSGNVLTSNGTTWQSTAPTSTGINVQSFTGSGTWTKPSLAAGSRVLIQAWGGGGSGGRGNASNYYGGGGGGGYNERWLTLSAMGATETVTVGAGGTGASVLNGGNIGGTTSVGSLISAYGGSFASNGGGGGGQLSAGSSTTPGLPRIMVDTDFSTNLYFQGSPQGSGISSFSTFIHGGGGGTPGGPPGAGANSVWGGGGGGSSGTTGSSGGTSSFGGAGGAGGTGTSANGSNGTQPGGGGGGTANATAGSGGAGQVIITVFPA
jgi:hypothetical protein